MTLKRLTLAAALILTMAVVLAPSHAIAQDEEAARPRLFINLTTDDTWSAAKAILFAHRRALANGYDTAIWLNVRAVYLAEIDRPSHIPGPMAEAGTSIQDMLTAFMADGGTVIMCSACSGAAGLTEEEYIDGVTMGTWPVVESWLFADDVRTLSW